MTLYAKEDMAKLEEKARAKAEEYKEHEKEVEYSRDLTRATGAKAEEEEEEAAKKAAKIAAEAAAAAAATSAAQQQLSKK